MINTTRERRVRTILCTADIPDGRTLTMAELVDGRFAVYLDHALPSALVWKQDQLNDCINAYLARKWDLQHPSATEANVPSRAPGQF